LQAELDEKMKLLSEEQRLRAQAALDKQKEEERKELERKDKQARLRTLRKFKRKH